MIAWWQDIGIKVGSGVLGAGMLAVAAWAWDTEGRVDTLEAVGRQVPVVLEVAQQNARDVAVLDERTESIQTTLSEIREDQRETLRLLRAGE
ncbi:MAG: hypothetical protein ACO4CZ_16055 [Planctomycetota bacterium]